MGGDAMGGLVLVILAAVVGMVVVPAVVLVWVSRRLSRGKSDQFRLAITAGSLLLGFGAGAAWATATFFETTWSPPPKVMLNLPPGFVHRSVILLEQPSAPRQLQWSGRDLPFMGKSVALDVPTSGVVRVRSFGDLAGAGFTAEATQGMRVTTMGSGPADAALDAKYYLYVGLEKSENDGVTAPTAESGEDVLHSPGKFAAYVKAREKN